MVKKHKGGRRQILQLEDKKATRKDEMEPTSTASLNKEASPLDSQVADFFKEIDALTVNENNDEGGSSEAACMPSEIASCSKQKDSEKPKTQEGASERSEGSSDDVHKEVYCPWQEICDENSGYNYYWNVETNEVTWDCPTEYIRHLKSIHSESETNFKLSQSHSKENPKMSKKKDVPLPPEGAIIPISYFGVSSSEESSDGEMENGFCSTSKQKHMVDRKHSTLKSNIKRTDRTEEVIGPQLPRDNHFSKKSSSSKNSFLSKEVEISSKNEVEEYLEIGPQLPSNSQTDTLKNDCSSVSDSSTKYNCTSQSYKNGSVVGSSTYEEPWEVSLKNIERKFRGLDQDIGEESPDSTVKKGDSLPENSVPCQTSNDVFGLRGVVEYNFTDDEEDEGMSSSTNTISSSKLESKTLECKGKKVFKEKESSFNGNVNKGQCSRTNNVYEYSGVSQNVSKRKTYPKFDCENYLAKKTKRNNVDIDSLFASHANSGKFGFGFSKQEQLNVESDRFCSTSSQQQFNISKEYGDYKAINFVKSDQVFDLNYVNKSSEENSDSAPNKNEVINNSIDNSCVAGTSGLNNSKYIQSSKDIVSKEVLSTHKEDAVSKGKLSSTENSSSSSRNTHLKVSSASEKKDIHSNQKGVSSSSTNDHYRLEDIDEIDRALCEALEAKKAENAISKPSSFVLPSSSQTKSDSSTLIRKTSLDCAKSSKSGSLSDDIVTLSNLLIDKLTFLISNHSSLTSLSSLLIQIQTRLVDWQAGSLESKYFMSRLQEVQQYLQHYELGAVSGDWSCQWDRENKRYFYQNSRTHQSQWTYPEELCGKEKSWMPSSTDIASTSSSSPAITLERDELQTVSSSVPERKHHKKSVSFAAESRKGISDKHPEKFLPWLSDTWESSPPPPPPGVDSPPPPPPPQTPPPDSPPPPPPDSTEVEDLEDMDIENSDDSNPPLIVTNNQADSVVDTHGQYPKFSISSPERSEAFTNTTVTNAVSSTSLSGFEDLNSVYKSPQLVSTSRDTFDNIDSVNMHWSMSQPSCSTDVNNFDSESEAHVLSEHTLPSVENDSEFSASSSSRSYACSNEVLPYRKSSSPGPSTSKKEKKKAILAPGLALKKKNIPSLVEKWQKIKKEQEKEDKNDDPKNSNSL